MATHIDYRSDPSGINRLVNGPEMHALLYQRAQLGARWVQANAPVDTGAYRAGIRVVDVGRGGRRRDRAAVQIQATTDNAVFVEHGSRGRPGYRLLARCISIVERG